MYPLQQAVISGVGLMVILQGCIEELSLGNCLGRQQDGKWQQTMNSSRTDITTVLPAKSDSDIMFSL